MSNNKTQQQLDLSINSFTSLKRKQNKRKQNAKENTERREKQYAQEIKECQTNTVIYNRDEINDFWSDTPLEHKPEIKVIDKDSVSAIFEYRDEPNLAVLNFASFKHPGGGYINGTHAQEECLCEESILYNVLRFFEDTWYKENLNHTNNSLYADRGLFSPNVIFERNDKTVKCGVITAACPNWKSYSEKKGNSILSQDNNSEALENRCRFILDIAKRQGTKTLILGAFGCGVFRQDPNEVSKIFKYLLEKYDYGFEKVIFAIPKFNNQSKTDNLEVFKNVFNC